MSKQEETTDHKLRSVSFEISGMEDFKKVWLLFANKVDVEPADGKEDSREKNHNHWIETDHVPHGDFVNAMRKLVDHGLESFGLQVTATNKKSFTVVGVTINGDIDMNQAQVSIVLAFKCDRAKKLIKLPACPEIELNDGGNFLAWKEVKKDLKEVEKEAVLFIQGKHFDDITPISFQLGIFDKPEKEVKEKKASTKKKEIEKPAVVPTPPMLGAPATA